VHLDVVIVILIVVNGDSNGKGVVSNRDALLRCFISDSRLWQSVGSNSVRIYISARLGASLTVAGYWVGDVIEAD
jgi:hypothetical protein